MTRNVSSRDSAIPAPFQYSKITRNIRVSVVPNYLDHQSSPGDHHYVWSYTIMVHNLGDHTVQLLNRYWNITDAYGRVQEVRGPGVVGEQPILKPGDSFEYTSGTSLNTHSGIMVGTYEMVDENDQHFDIDIPAFSLDSPYQISRPN